MTTERTTALRVRCPTCRKDGPWFDSAYGPFCSKRCKMVDLGKWFGEEHAISEPLRLEHLEGNEPVPEQELPIRLDHGGLK